MSDGAGVHFGASEPRHDGAAIPEGAAAPVTERAAFAPKAYTVRLSMGESEAGGFSRAMHGARRL